LEGTLYMRMYLRVVFLLLIMLLALPAHSLCQFESYNFSTPHRFAELGWGAGNNTRGEKCIDRFGTNVYIAAEANGGGSTMQCNRSTDDGAIWDTLAGIEWSDSRYLSLSIDEGGRVYITWFYHNTTYNGLCKTAALYGNSFQSTGTGNTWVDWYSDLWFAGCPSISAKGTGEGNPLICASQESFGGTQNYEITLDCPLATMAWNNFNYWQNTSHDEYLTYPIINQIRPCIRLDDGNYVHITWEDNRSTVQRLAYRRSSNVLSSGGTWPLTWNALTYIDDTGHNTKGSTIGYIQGHSQIIVTGSGSSATIYVVWVASDNNIYLDRSTDGGATWGTDVRVNDAVAAIREWPSISRDGLGNLYFVWMDNRDGNNNVYFSYSKDGGNTFSPDTLIHNGLPDDKYPGIVEGQQTGPLSEVHIAWTRVDTTMYAKGTPVLVGISEISFIATETSNGILLSWEKRGYTNGAVWLLSKRESQATYQIIARFEAGETVNSYLDVNVQSGKTYLYKLVLFDTEGNQLAVREASATMHPLHKETYLTVVSNPCKAVTLQYGFPDFLDGCNLAILDIQGRIVKTFSPTSIRKSGTISWNGTDERGRQCPDGVYFALLSSGTQKKTAKFILLR
jgi:hypothetical protein